MYNKFIVFLDHQKKILKKHMFFFKGLILVISTNFNPILIYFNLIYFNIIKH